LRGAAVASRPGHRASERTAPTTASNPYSLWFDIYCFMSEPALTSQPAIFILPAPPPPPVAPPETRFNSSSVSSLLSGSVVFVGSSGLTSGLVSSLMIHPLPSAQRRTKSRRAVSDTNRFSKVFDWRAPKNVPHDGREPASRSLSVSSSFLTMPLSSGTPSRLPGSLVFSSFCDVI
jgi:hypothetical protein